MDYNDASSVNINSTSTFQKFNIETVFYSTMNNFLTMPRPSSGALSDTILYSSYNSNDLRKTAFFRIVSGYPSFKGSYSRSMSFLFSGIATDELYLTSAECYARTGQTSLALQDLNTLLKKRWRTSFFTPITANSSQEALQIILTERRKELLMRGLRWMDIKRLNSEGAGIILKRRLSTGEIILPPNDKRYALPIPADVIRESGISQNPY